ncbi:MAG: two-component sensor histidine kinase [Propionibacterium sp.]|nr:two-component sensor histidine kinase [Propionibacterium sp.]
MQAWPVISARRFELYVRWTLYILMAVLPIQAGAIAVGASSNRELLPAALGAFAASLVVTAFNVVVAKRSLDAVIGPRRPFSPVFIVGWVISLIVMTAAMVLLLDGIPGVVVVAFMPTALAMAALSPALGIRTTLVITAAVVVLAGVLAIFGVVGALPAAAFAVFTLWAAWSSGWMLRVLRQLQQAHETEAQLVLAEERLRISRDLHDVFGRTLATISVKSELATELSRRGHHDRAADEMAHIRRIANSAGAEVRRVVRGERTAGWEDELTGARALLSSAGIDCVIAGDEVPREWAPTLAWVIREGVTNVLRHSKAARVTITTSVAEDEVALTLTNDGAGAPSATTSTGTGLTSMTERLAAVGGTLEAERDGDWFVLTASIPIHQEVTG